jgi:gamma-glutamyltranspeptidase/glutathione hydrolase
MREFTRENQSRFAQFTSTRDLFLFGGGLPDVGSVFRNPDLANTYRLIAHGGRWSAKSPQQQLCD